MNKDTRKKPWPTQAVMSQIYTQKLWGKGSGNFYSGDGSHDEHLVNPYIEVVSNFLQSFELPLIVCDLGCGDFNVGKQLVPFCKGYKAVDIVTELIDFNRQIFTQDNLEFFCLDISSDTLPSADCIILRQVLQHLSNDEISNILNKLTEYSCVILTEHIPEGQFQANKDIIAGQGTRLKLQSGVDILASPFQFTVKSSQCLLSLSPATHGGRIVTMLYEL